MPFVGLRGLEKQLALKRGLLADIEAQERQLAPVVNAVQGIIDRAADFIPAHSSLVGDLRDAQRLPEVDESVEASALPASIPLTGEVLRRRKSNWPLSTRNWMPGRRSSASCFRVKNEGEIDRLRT